MANISSKVSRYQGPSNTTNGPSDESEANSTQKS